MQIEVVGKLAARQPALADPFSSQWVSDAAQSVLPTTTDVPRRYAQRAADAFDQLIVTGQGAVIPNGDVPRPARGSIAECSPGCRN